MKTEQDMENEIDRLGRAVRKKRKKDRKLQLKKLKRIFKEDPSIGEMLFECIDEAVGYFREVHPAWYCGAARGLRLVLQDGSDQIAVRLTTTNKLAQTNGSRKKKK